MFQAHGDDPGPLNGLSTDTAYTTKDLLQTARYKAQSAGCAYVYDYPTLFEESLKQTWMERGMEKPEEFCSFVELILDSSKKGLLEVSREPAQNTIGMVAWKMKIAQPEFKGAREIIVIANDSTYEQGSFGPKEDALFSAASTYARKHKLPRIYICGNNSGARIGLCKDIEKCFKVAWKGENKTTVDYMYLTPQDFTKYGHLVIGEHILVDGQSRYKITAILGNDDCGTAALRGSGLIAGETSKAYSEIPTLSLVTGRAVGIGAYLVRLGQRVIQVESSYIILTGYRALNSVLGSNVYSSHQQLGGPQIMAKNGVSHLTVSDDFTGVRSILHWLSYIPPAGTILDSISSRVIQDPVSRPVTVEIKSKIYDPREILAGSVDTLGILDRGSLFELQPDWAKTAFVGRGRLGGIPVGIVSAETRSVQLEIPADPADRDSQEKNCQQAGQVWFPDSAFKTAQAIRDIDAEGLPLLMLANWRGFSGGMKDMYDQILKFGAMIVDALSSYSSAPVLVYIPPYGELRGGAWAVLDPSINKSKIEIYADPSARSSVLEPEGTVQIKIKNLNSLSSRLDEEINNLETKLANLATAAKNDNSARAEMEQKLEERRNNLKDQYHGVAVEFADLHDRPIGTMKRGCLNGVVELKNTRKFLYHRLNRLLIQAKVVHKMEKAQPEMSGLQADCEIDENTKENVINVLERIFIQQNGIKGLQWDDDQAVSEWLQKELNDPNSHISHRVSQYSNSKILRDLTKLCKDQEADDVANVFQNILENLSKEQQFTILSILTNSVDEK